MIKGGNVGAMDILLTVEQPVKTTGSKTNEVLISSWSTFGTLWAEEIKYPSSNEEFEADQQVAKQTSYFRTRDLDGLKEEMRVTRDDTDEVSYIKGIEVIDRKKFLILKTEKRDNG